MQRRTNPEDARWLIDRVREVRERLLAAGAVVEFVDF
jgi:hypothetical protein